MIHRIFKRIVPFVLVLLVLLTLPLNADAATVIDLTRTGSIKIQLRDVYFPDTPIGGTLVLHKVGNAQIVDHNLSFALTEGFAGSGVSLKDLRVSTLPQELADYAAEQNLLGTAVQADESGFVTFSSLSTGLYLVTQTEAVEGYLTVSPFLVSLPMYNEASGTYIYTVEAAPKVQRPPKDDISVTVVKKWQDNNKNRPESLTVNLLKEGEVVDTVVITAEDQWKYTWTGLNAYYKWTVEEEIPEGYFAAYQTYENTTTITNRASWYVPPKDQLIQTGQLNWPVPVLACAGLFLLLAGCILIRRGKRSA